jgi:DNA-binding winged helix-turn-helix (wHTH) protein/tetratricopeptide (TPR) repeat protein
MTDKTEQMTRLPPGPKGSLYRYRFGEAEFDEASFELRVAGAVLDVQPKPLSVLAVLLANAGEVMTREELIESVWSGRPTVDHVVANAVSKLRTALGDETGAIIVTVPRVGYRLNSAVERVAVGRALDSQLALRMGEAVPERPNFELYELLHTSPGAEVWLARHVKTREVRVYKFSVGGERLSALKREATLFRLLQDSWGNRDDFVRIIDWNFQTAPYFLECEYGGQNLGQWALGESLSTLDRAARLELFLRIADAVAAAHAIGVLHKDLKPGNVLIAPRSDGGWHVRLTDFGSARLLEPERLADIGITRLGFTRDVTSDSSDSGTPLYVAPELLAHQTPTVKSDLYSLGLLLYQLVIGDLRRPMGSGWQRDIDDTLLRADIEAATDIDPRHRLNSVAELSDRLRRLDERHRQREQAETMQSQARLAEAALQRARARQPWIAATIIVLAAGLALSALLLYRSYRSEQALAHRNEVVRNLNDFLTNDLIGQANPGRSGRVDFPVAEAARIAAARIDERFGAESPDVRAELHHAMEVAFSQLSDYRRAIDEARKALAIYAQLPNAERAPIRDAQIYLARNLHYVGEMQESEKLFKTLTADVTSDASAPPEFAARICSEYGFLLRIQGRQTEAVALLEKGRALALNAGAAGEHVLENIDLGLAAAHMSLGHTDQGRTLLEGLIGRQTKAYGADSAQVGTTLTTLGQNFMQASRYDEARATLERSLAILTKRLGAEHIRTLAARDLTATMAYDTGDFASAARQHEELFRISSKNPDGPKEPPIMTRANWALDLYQLGRFADAEKLLRDNLIAIRSWIGVDSATGQEMRYYLAVCLLEQRQTREAQDLLQHLDVGVLEREHSLRNWAGWIAYQQGRVLVQTGRAADAVSQFAKARDLEAALPPATRIDDRDLAALAREGLEKAQQQIAALHDDGDKRPTRTADSR